MGYKEELINEAGFKYEDALMRFLNREDMLEKFLLKFLDDPSYANILKSYADGDREGTGHAAHALKGVAANLGLEKLRAASEKLQKTALTPDGGDIAPLYDDVVVAYECCERIIKSNLGV